MAADFALSRDVLDIPREPSVMITHPDFESHLGVLLEIVMSQVGWSAGDGGTEGESWSMDWPSIVFLMPLRPGGPNQWNLIALPLCAEGGYLPGD